jgi:hypothetical protein
MDKQSPLAAFWMHSLIPLKETNGGFPLFSNSSLASLVSLCLAINSFSDMLGTVSLIFSFAHSVSASSIHFSFILSNSNTLSV